MSPNINLEDVLVGRTVLGDYKIEFYDPEDLTFTIRIGMSVSNTSDTYLCMQRKKLLEELKLNKDKVLEDILKNCPEYLI